VGCIALNDMISWPYEMCMYNPFEDASMTDIVANCCEDGLNGCTGVCVSSASTLTVLKPSGPRGLNFAKIVPITEVKPGDKVLAATHNGGKAGSNPR